MTTIDEAWLQTALSSPLVPQAAGSANRLRHLLEECAYEFARRRTDVETPTITWPRRGVMPDEAASFLRAVAEGFAQVDAAGYVTLPEVRPKLPEGRYALLSKSGSGVSINLEYVVQIGATAELVLDHEWPPQCIDFERGEFDALASAEGRVVLAMEAKARMTGPDSLEKLVRSWLTALSDPSTDMKNNAGRKLRELQRLCDAGPVTVWLVAEGARWTMQATKVNDRLTLAPGTSAKPAL